MVNEDTIAYIVDTYELPSRLAEKVTRLAVRTLAAHDIESFDYQYGYIAALVDRYTRRRGPSREESLDAAISDGDNRTLYCLIGRSNAEEAEKAKEAQEGGYREMDVNWHELLRQSLAYVKPRLSRPQRAFLQKLADQTNGGVRVKPFRVAAEVESIRDRMDELSAKYQRLGHITLPKRPIKEVRFSPLYIRFGGRNLKGQALEFFRAHEDTYGNLTRSELARFDPGLYQALQSQGTLDRAIP